MIPPSSLVSFCGEGSINFLCAPHLDDPSPLVSLVGWIDLLLRPRSHYFRYIRLWMGGGLRFAVDAEPVVMVAILTRPTLGAPRRALFPGGDGETQCLKIHSGEAADGSSCGAKKRQAMRRIQR